MTLHSSPSPTPISRSHTPSPAPSRTESLVAHPLLASPAPPSPVPSSVTSGSGPQLTPPHYVPYTPRQRPQAQTATMSGNWSANATVSQPGQQQQADATRRLQMTNLQSAVQVYGIETNSVGWALLEWLVEGVNESIWHAISHNKAVVLLPLERQEKDKITIEFVKDHVAYVYGTELVTLSGLRGTLKENTFVISSTLHPSSSFFCSFSSPNNRHAESTSVSLPPLAPSHPDHPHYVIPSHISSLPLPYPKLVVPPPLPIRPSASNSSRISNPFASLFGGGSKRPSPASVSSRSASPAPSINSVDGAATTTDPHPHTVHISACTINKRIIRAQVGTALDSTLIQRTHSALSPPHHLNGEGLDDVDRWVLETVVEFVKHWAPLVRIDSLKERDSMVAGRQKHKNNAHAHYVVNDLWSRDTELLGMEDVGRRFQGFMEEIEGGVKTLMDSREDVEKRKEERDFDADKERITLILEKVEGLLCTLFYDRLFAPLQDVEHDKVLRERVDTAIETLGLDELGVRVDVLSSEDGSILEDDSSGQDTIREVTDSCGAVLERLNRPDCRCPRDKSKILVEVHKILVDGLSNLPTLRISAKVENDMTGSTELKTLEPTHRPEPINDPLLSPADPRTSDPSSPNSLSPLDVSPLPLPPAPPTPSPLSSDMLLPLLIYTILNTAPERLLSHLLYVQRFRSPSLSTGEEAFCLVNLLAGVEYLMQIQGPKTPRAPTPPPPPSIALQHPTPTAATSAMGGGPSSPVKASFIVDALTGSANKMINGVVDSSFGILKSISLLTPSSSPVALPPISPEDAASTSVTSTHPQQGVSSTTGGANAKMGLLRRENGLSLRALTASLPGKIGTPTMSPLDIEGQGRPMLVVNGGSASASSSSTDSEDSVGDEDGSGGGEYEEGEMDYDVRGIRSFESMMSERGGRRGIRAWQGQRSPLSERLASVSGSPASITKPLKAINGDSMVYPVPNARFMECDAGDLKLSEVGELLAEYRKLVKAVKVNGGYAH